MLFYNSQLIRIRAVRICTSVNPIVNALIIIQLMQNHLKRSLKRIWIKNKFIRKTYAVIIHLISQRPDEKFTQTETKFPFRGICFLYSKWKQQLSGGWLLAWKSYSPLRLYRGGGKFSRLLRAPLFSLEPAIRIPNLPFLPKSHQERDDLALRGNIRARVCMWPCRPQIEDAFEWKLLPFIRPTSQKPTCVESVLALHVYLYLPICVCARSVFTKNFVTSFLFQVSHWNCNGSLQRFNYRVLWYEMFALFR